MYRYYTKGVCSKSILMEINEDILEEVVFEGGCAGNLIALKQLVEGMNIDEIINRFENIPCKERGTSCPDQLAKALKIYKEYVYKKQ
ncbi:MAG: TIGR03905 family TSCPD domain-containing protein [Romboutsia sp.]|nr:TIGR03905 family TSCPD domain-containing protein [Romboutsia sp.]